MPHAAAFVTEYWDDIPTPIRQAIDVQVQAAMFRTWEADPAKRADAVAALPVAKPRDTYKPQLAGTRPIAGHFGKMLWLSISVTASNERYGQEYNCNEGQIIFGRCSSRSHFAAWRSVRRNRRSIDDHFVRYIPHLRKELLYAFRRCQGCEH